MKTSKTLALTLAAAATALLALTGCAAAEIPAAQTAAAQPVTLVEAAPAEAPETVEAPEAAEAESIPADNVLEATEFFSDRDLRQTADTSDAVAYTLADGEDIAITAEGVYVLTGSAKDVTVTVTADKSEKVQLVLDGVTIENESEPCIVVESADKVFLTTSADSSLTVTGAFLEGYDGVIFSRDDLTLNGSAALTITSSDNGVVCKDDLRLTGGTYTITAAAKCLEANDSIRVAGGTYTLTAGDDALHAENSDDDSLGYIYISGGDFGISAGDDGVHATSVARIDDGNLTISAAEGIEATYVQINGGTINISSWDDGINGAQKSSAYRATIEITGGEITVVMSAGDTDGIDCNGDLIISGGVIDVTGNSTFDYDGAGTYTGGTIIVNGQQVDTLPNQMGFGGGRGGRGNRWG